MGKHFLPFLVAKGCVSVVLMIRGVPGEVWVSGVVVGDGRSVGVGVGGGWLQEGRCGLSVWVGIVGEHWRGCGCLWMSRKGKQGRDLRVRGMGALVQV